ncbi:MAG TPA: SRPBCC domain-containing protein [Terriglobales bacterium]
MPNQPVRTLYTQVEIQAPPEKVWQVLTDFAAYPQWNPYMRIHGKAEQGSRLFVSAGRNGHRGLMFWPKVTVFKPQQELRWVGHLLIPGLFDGEHSFLIEPLPTGGVRFIQEERFRGSLVQPAWNYITTDTAQGFRDMNQALKARCEQHRTVGAPFKPSFGLSGVVCSARVL